MSALTLHAVANTDALSPRLLPATALLLLYLAALMTAIRTRTRRPRLGIAAFALQLISAFALGLLLPIGWLPIFTILWLAMVPAFLPGRTLAFVLLAGVMVAWYAIQAVAWSAPDALRQVLLWGVFHLFAAFSALETQAARRARDEIATLNRELVATRHLLEETSRSTERARIARDLHDLLGHHLTALSIQLQVASRRAEGDLKGDLEQCHALARLLLSDVREAVSELRAEGGIDVVAALRALAAHTPGVSVDLRVPPSLHTTDVTTARTLLRCIQEALTNTLRHAAATRCRIDVAQVDGAIHVTIHDDGTVHGALRPGNGLNGMRERVEALNGSLHLGRHGRALCLTIHLPGATR